MRDLHLFAAGLGVLLVAGLALTLTGRGRLSELEDRNAELAAEVCRLDPCCDGGAPIPGCERLDHEALAGELETRLAVIDGLDERRRRLPAWTAALELAIPPDAWLTRLSLTDEGLELFGRTHTIDGAAAAMSGLQASPCFAEVQLVSTGASPRGRSQEFHLKAGLTDDCDARSPVGRDLFRRPPTEEEQQAPRAHPQVRWGLRAYVVVAVSPGELAWLRDPDGGTHQVVEGSVLGSEGARVTVVTDNSVILTLDEILDAETGEASTRIITLRLEQE